MNMRSFFVILSILAAVGLGGSLWLAASRPRADAPPGRTVVRVAAASDLRFALDEVIAAFHQSHPAIQVRATFGSSGNFFAQLSQSAPFDLFLSADMDYPRRLIDAGLAEKDSLFRYAVGHVVVWVPANSALDLNRLNIRALLDPSVHKVAVANPKYAPYGRAAVAALQSLGVYDQVRDHLAYGETVAQAAQFVQSGAADVGVIGLSQALSPALKEQGRYWEVPIDAYPRLDQGGVILAWAQDRAAAEAVRDFLRGGEGKEILRRYGFVIPE
jgi:molybdate transport system substrate-binding protein